MDSEIKKIREELALISVKSYERGLTSGAGGNISVRVKDKELAVITASGISFRDVTPQNLIVVDFDCRVVEGDLKPSKETKWHCGIYKYRPELGSVFHSHSTAATAYSTKGLTVPLLTGPFEKNIGHHGVVPYAPAGSDELAEYVINAYKNSTERVLILSRHGAVATGPTLTDAFNLADLLEDAAKTAIFADLIGRKN